MKSLYLIKPYFVENRRIIFFGLVCLIAVDFLQLIIPRVIKWVVDDLTAFRIDLKNLLFYALYIVGIALLIACFRYVWRRCLIGMSRRVEEGLRNKLFEHIQTLSASYFDKVKTGDLMAHATNDIIHIRMATGLGLVALTDAIVLGTAAIGFMVYINIRLTLLVLIPMPFIAFGTRFFTKKMHRLYQKVQASFADLTEVVRERFAGIRIIKAHNMEKESTARLEAISQGYVSKNLSLVKITSTFFPMMMFFANLSLAIVLYRGGRQTLFTIITPGDFVAFIGYLGLLTWPMMALGWVANLIQRGTASLDRIDRILRTRPDIGNIPGAKSIKKIEGAVFFENVTFFYDSDTPPILNEINIKIQPGQILGIIGPPGSGKTTLLNLIPRLFDVSQGCIRIDGIDIREMKIHDLRSCISFMPQEPFLFAGTIGGNIAFGHKKTNDTKLRQAADDACLTNMIKSFPAGFETIVGEKGVILSGGQKQRIALARAFLRNTPILVLDDPVSQVDMETGSAIIKSIKAMAGDRTIFIVSHRLSAVRFADSIIVLSGGRIVESGTHDQLMAYGQYYAKTFRLQEIEEEYYDF